MITLAIGKDRITIIPIEGEEIWTDITINKCYQDSEGSFIGLRKNLLDIALLRNVKFLNIKIKDAGLEIDINPQEFITKSKIMEMPSKYPNSKPFIQYLYPISNLIQERNKKGRQN